MLGGVHGYSPRQEAGPRAGFKVDVSLDAVAVDLVILHHVVPVTHTLRMETLDSLRVKRVRLLYPRPTRSVWEPSTACGSNALDCR